MMKKPAGIVEDGFDSIQQRESELERLQKPVQDRPGESSQNPDFTKETPQINRARTKRRKYEDEEDEESPVVRKSRRLCKKLVPALVCNYLISDNVFIYVLDTLLMFF
ncbi:unnamed protein product, partial [Mesorhabditis belari]|uniref:Uncharacterized protein n=1 Tax=Mesorhabditis belari TaxID=2138241 RepID=A0AAF3JAZ7_9BILA